MIIDKNPLPDDPTPLDPPPSYEELQRVAQELTRPIDRKATYTQPSSASSRPLSGKRLASSSKKPKWFNPFGQAARTSQEVKSTILNLVRDVVRVPDPTAAISILRNCSEACETHGLQFSVVLQEKSVEGHTPIYWAIVKRPPQPTSSDPDLVSALLSLAAPLNDTTLSEIRLACLQNSDQILFQRLRRLPAFAPLSGPDEILLGGTVPPDDIGVQDVPGGEGAFIARFVVPLFQKRMRITKSIQLEFIARSRMWLLEFIISEGRKPECEYEKGTWLVRLSLVEHSPSTWIQSQVIIDEPQGGAAPRRNRSNPIEINLKTKNSQLAPAERRNGCVNALSTPLNKSTFGNSLQFDGCPYIDSAGSLSGRLEANLVKVERSDCIIC